MLKSISSSSKKESFYAGHESRRKDFCYTTGPLQESLIENHYWIVLVDYHSRYSLSFLNIKKLQLPKEMAKFFEKVM